MNHPYNEPAFPLVPGDSKYEGMSLRDYFQAHILQGLCANPSIFAPNSDQGWGLVNVSDAQIVSYAGHLAEHCLKERLP